MINFNVIISIIEILSADRVWAFVTIIPLDYVDVRKGQPRTQAHFTDVLIYVLQIIRIHFFFTNPITTWIYRWNVFVVRFVTVEPIEIFA